jgi:uncharacterized tellurite resistance protein B-like protein
LAKDAMELIKNLLNDGDWQVRRSAAGALGKIVACDPSLAKDAMELIKNLLSDYSVRSSAALALGEIVKSDSSLANKDAMELIKNFLKNGYRDVRESAVKALVEIVKSDPNLAKDAYEQIKPLLKDGESYVRSSAAKALGEIVKSDSSLAKDAMELIKNLLKDGGLYVRKSAGKSAMELIKPVLKDGDRNVRESAALALGEIVKSDSSLAKDVMELIKNLLKDGDWNVRFSAVKALGEIVKSDSSFAPDAMELIQNLLKHGDGYVSYFTNALGEIVKSDSSFAPDAMELIKPLLKHGDWRVRESAVKAIILMEEELIDKLIGNEWVSSRIIDDLVAINYEKNVSNFISSMAEKAKKLPKEVAGKFVNIFNDKYKDNKIKELIEKEFSFLTAPKSIDENEERFNKLLDEFDESEETLSFLAEYIINYQIKVTIEKLNGNVSLKIGSKTIINKDDIYCLKLLSSIKQKSEELGKIFLFRHFALEKDFDKVFSIADPKAELEFGKYQVTILRQDDKDSSNLYSVFFETRNLFGEIIIYKITNGSFFHEVKKTIDDEAKESLIVSGKYYVKSFALEEYLEVENFISKISNKGETLENVIKFINILNSDIKIDLDLKEYKESCEIREFEKIDIKKDIKKLEKKVKEHDKQIGEIKKELGKLEKEFKLTKEQVNAIEKSMKDYRVDSEDIRKLLESAKNLDGVPKDPYKKGFYESFVRELNSTYGAALVVSTDIVANNKKGLCSSIGGALKSLGSNIPVFGLGVQFFGCILSAVDTKKQAEMVKKFAELAIDHQEMSNIAKYIAKELLKVNGRIEFKGKQTIFEKCKSSLSNILDIGAKITEGGANKLDKDKEVENFQDFFPLLKDSMQDQAIEQGGETTNNLGNGIISKIKSGFRRTSTIAEEKAKKQEEELGKIDGSNIAKIIISKVFAGEIDKDNIKSIYKTLLKDEQETIDQADVSFIITDKATPQDSSLKREVTLKSSNLSEKEYSLAIAKEILFAIKEEEIPLSKKFEEKFIKDISGKLQVAAMSHGKRFIDTIMISENFKDAIIKSISENLVEKLQAHPDLTMTTKFLNALFKDVEKDLRESGDIFVNDKNQETISIWIVDKIVYEEEPYQGKLLGDENNKLPSLDLE